MASYQVVAVYPSGRRYEIRNPHPTLAAAQWHLYCANRQHDDPTYHYAIDATYIGADGQQHWRASVDAPCSDCQV